ncbi:MAG TPA: di-heme oxidoredictase family protein [Terriglobales bacterium]|jgi:mono/diheme cytochrome c family protein|nr:di-heme oxidoredictase family protein [Terriglobales bacterium]
MKHRKSTKLEILQPVHLLTLCLTVVLCTGILQAQHDPGPRGGAAGAGGFYPTLDGNEQAFFSQALDRFKEIDSVSGNVPGEAGVGLGPTFNANSCAACHAQPDVGGSSPGLRSPQKPVPNPQVAFATLDGATNTVPPFISANGPVREARFVSTNTADPYAALDGGVHGLYTIAGRSDAIGCNLQQPDFATQLANHNVIFRIPTPTFGLGLIENTPDAVLEANLAANSAAKSALGIGGKLNRTGNDGTVTRFGWKAQNKSLVIFSGEAYNVEQGVANEVFPNERAAVPGCVFNSTPEDSTNITNPDDPTSTTGTASKMSSDTVNFAAFMRLTAPPTATTHTASELNGQKLFSSVGCVLCHSSTLTTGQSPFTGMSNVVYHPYSDIAVHHMGSNLADGVNQGGAGPDEFRTAPLWGVGQRLFFLHDGRTSDLLQAIKAHASSGNICVVTQDFQQFSINNGVSYFQPFSQSQTCGSEANGVISNFNSLSSSQKQDLLNFLRSL